MNHAIESQNLRTVGLEGTLNPIQPQPPIMSGAAPHQLGLLKVHLTWSGAAPGMEHHSCLANCCKCVVRPWGQGKAAVR